jgi:hypothetical protein
LLLAKLSKDNKIFLSLNCWSFYNKQNYLTINAYFIDEAFKLHEVLLIFKHVNEHHIEVRLACILIDILKQYHIKNRIYAIITDNAENNLTMHIKLIRFIRFSLFENVETNLLDSNVQELSVQESNMQESNMQKSNMKKISCLVHVIQLTFFDLLRKIRIKLSNDDFQIRWDEKNDRRKMNAMKKKVSYTLTKIIWRMCSYLASSD